MSRIAASPAATASSAAVREPQYDDATFRFTELIWGAGFVSPGGEGDVARILQGVQVAGRRVLDVGCGVGGADVALVRNHEAGRVTGIDIEEMQIGLAKRRAAEAGLADRLEFLLVEPGPLPFEDGAFDLVFSKDAIDKLGEVFKVLFATRERVKKDIEKDTRGQAGSGSERGRGPDPDRGDAS